MNNSVSFTYISKEFVAKSFTFACTFYKSCYVHNLACGRYDTSRMNNLCQFGQSLVGNRGDTYVRFYCTEREVRCLCLSTGYAVEKSRFPYIRKAYYTTF